MKTIISNYVVFFDVDETLVEATQFNDSRKMVDIHFQKAIYKQAAIMENIKALISEKNKGAVVIVWSMGGYEWAESVVYALKLESHVDYIMSKPSKYYDDLSCQEWMGKRVHLGEASDK